MDRGIGARVPTLGLPGFHGYPVVVPDGEIVTSNSGHTQNYTNTGEDYIDGAPLVNNRIGHMHMDTTMYNRNTLLNADITQCDSGFSSGFSSVGSMIHPALDNIKIQQSTDMYTTLTPDSDLYAEDEAYNSITSLPPADMIFTQDIDGDTMLHMAIIQDDALMALAFIRSAEKTSDLMIVNNLCQTPLHLAAYLNLPTVVESLIRSQVALDTRNRDGNTSLHLACREGHLEVAKSLIAAQPGLASVMNYDGLTCLHLAVKHNQLQIAALLIQSGAANVNAGDGCSGRTVLHQAVQAGQEALVLFLVTQCRADVNAAARDGLTPLMIAIGQQQHAIVSLLQQYGAIYVDSVADDGFCSEDEMDFDSSDLYQRVQHLTLNGDSLAHSDEEDLYS